MESLEEKIARVLSEEISLVKYDPNWVAMFELEKRHLIDCLPKSIVMRIEHFGSTAIPGIFSKPIIDMLVEVSSLKETRKFIVPILENQGYDYFWRPSWGDDIPPYYAWFIKRNKEGARTHHIHMVESGFENWERLLFRDYLKEHPNLAQEYSDLKEDLSIQFKNDRVQYTNAKTDFITKATNSAKEYYNT